MFDFTMKHEGEPPARLVAQLRMRLKEQNYPPMLAEVLAPVVESPDDLDEELMVQIEAIVRMLEREKVPAEEAMTAIRDVVAELMAEAGSEEEPEEGDITAWYPKRREGDKAQRQLSQLVRMKIRSNRPQVRINGRSPRMDRMGNTVGSLTRHRAALSDALQARIDRQHKPTVGAQFVQMPMAEMLMMALRDAGQRPMNVREAIRMAGVHSASDFPLILEDALSKTVARQLEQTAPALARAAHEIPAEDYRFGNLLSLSASGMPEEIGEGGEIKHVTIDEKGERKPAPRDFGAMFHLSNKAIVNDDLGVFEQIGKKMVAGATERYRRVLLEPLLANGGLGNTMADGNPVFHANHGNLAGTGEALTVTSLSSARLALRSQRGLQGEHYAIEPWALVVPPHLETIAQQVLAEINATKTADVNPFSGALELIVEVGLTSPTAWYLIGNPASTDGLAYSFLEGQSAPRVESKPGWDTLGTEFRLVWALDARFVSYSSWFKNPGA